MTVIGEIEKKTEIEEAVEIEIEIGTEDVGTEVEVVAEGQGHVQGNEEKDQDAQDHAQDLDRDDLGQGPRNIQDVGQGLDQDQGEGPVVDLEDPVVGLTRKAGDLIADQDHGADQKDLEVKMVPGSLTQDLKREIGEKGT